MANRFTFQKLQELKFNNSMALNDSDQLVNKLRSANALQVYVTSLINVINREMQKHFKQKQRENLY